MTENVLGARHSKKIFCHIAEWFGSIVPEVLVLFKAWQDGHAGRVKARSSRSNQAREAGRWPGDVHDESVNMMEIELGKGGFREVFR